MHLIVNPAVQSSSLSKVDKVQCLHDRVSKTYIHSHRKVIPALTSLGAVNNDRQLYPQGQKRSIIKPRPEPRGKIWQVYFWVA